MALKIFHVQGGDLPDLRSLVGDIEDWELQVPPEVSRFESDYSRGFWLGGTEDGRHWFLAASQGEFEPFRDVVVACTGEPSREKHYISQVLFRALEAVESGQGNTAEMEAQILASVKKPVFRTAVEYLAELPQAWHALPCELVLGFTLSEGAHVSRQTFREYRRDSFPEALQVLKSGRRDGLLLHYQLQARGVVPLLAWDADWPLARIGKENPHPRKKIQQAVPWESEADPTLLEIYQYVPSSGVWAAGPDYFGEPAIRLRVGGIDSGKAKSNWTMCAKALRQVSAQRPS